MNFQRLINQFMRIFTRRAINHGLNRMARPAKGQDGKASAARVKATKDMRAAAKRARQAARITRRLGR